MNRSLLILTLLLIPSLAFSAEKGEKGLLPELRINGTDENVNEKKALQSEVLITKTENQAIQSLIAILKKKKGSSMEPDLWYRLAELYMRRAKSGRFFDLHRNDSSGPVKFIPPEIKSESSAASLKRAIQVYTKIERDFPKFREMDGVLFNNAFASQQVKMGKNAEALYYKVVTQHPRSPLVPDSYLALGEMAYENKNFKDALEYFKAIEKYPKSRVYSYGLYKSAWTLYNLRQNEDAMRKLIQVVKYHDPATQDGQLVNHNLRAESLRDLTLFYGESQPADKAYAFFSRIGTPDEVGEAIYNLGRLFDSHSRHKEMNVFLTEFMKKQPLSRFRVKMEMLMITGNEVARARHDSLKHLVAAAAICKKGSEWRDANKDIAESECDYDFAKANVDMAKKWWDLWQKNKNATAAREIAEYTQEAFRLHLDREDPKKPDAKSRYAYAELLFQLGDYRKASNQYEYAGTKAVDTTIAHDSTYSSIVALEKATAKKKEATDEGDLVRLCQTYLQRYPKGEHATQVKFKIGFIAYEQNNHGEAEKWLAPLAADPGAGEFKRKSEDLILDILNDRKDFKAIKEFSKQIAGQTKDDTRKAALGKIIREADYSEIQEYAKSSEKTKAAERLVAFYNENKTSPLAKDSLWQALSLYYADGKVIDGAEIAHQYAKTYPDDKRSLDALKDAAKHYADSGLILPAAETMQQIASVSEKDKEKYVEAASELYLIEGRTKEAQESLKKQLTEKNTANHGKIYAKLLTTMKGQESSAEYKKIEDKIVSMGHEPYASEIRVKRVEALLTSGKQSEAFNSAKALVGEDGKTDDDIRARARLVQAKVLEREFVETRTKTTVEKLAVVLSIKTEKLDKAQTAYLTAAKIAKDPNTKHQALQGLNRIYTNYVDTVGHPNLKDEAALTPDDKKALAAQLTQLVTPILEKKVDTDKQLQKLAKESKAAGSVEVDFASLPVEETVKPQVKNLSKDQMKVYLPAFGSEGLLMEATRYEASNSDKCGYTDADKTANILQLSRKANACVLTKNANQTEKLAMAITRKDPKSALGAFYLSLVAEMQGKFEKSAWLVDLALKKSADVPFLLYQKGRALYQAEDFAHANAAFIKAHDLGIKTPETILMHGIVSFAQGDCFSVMEDFGKLDRSSVAKYNLGPVMSECQAQKGEFDKAVAFAEESAKSATAPADLWLQLGRIQEIYRFDSAKAVTAYESALKTAGNADMKDWIQRKLNFLKGKHTVTVLQPQNVTGKDNDGGQE
ncbi:MAG: tetratricopeptide repeat protein [Pseudobdellovibrionaceae bacterium]